MKKFTITVISLFMVLLISLSAISEAMGTSSKYASNQDYIQSENLALKDKSNKISDDDDEDDDSVSDTVTITASSIEELLSRIQKESQSYLSDNILSDAEKSVGRGFDYFL